MDDCFRTSPSAAVAAESPADTGLSGFSGCLTIDLSALRRNYRTLSAMLAPVKAAGVVKADAYGLGAAPVSRALYDEGCRHFFVAHFGEAQSLNPHLPDDARLFVLNGLQPGQEPTCARMGVVPVLNSLAQFHRWAETAAGLGQRLPAVLQFDTGMSRLGIPPEERAAVAAALAAGTGVDVLFVMSHLACADEPEQPQNGAQHETLRQIADDFPQYGVCFANSGGIFLGPQYHGILARPGIALYGGAPNTTRPNPMEAVVRLDLAVIQTRTVPAGTRVGYGGAHVTRIETRLATLAAGYADGLPRCLGDVGAVWYHGIRLPIVGRVSMDSMTVDISALPEGTLSLGSAVEMIGPHQTLDDLADAAGTISYEILTSLGHRYHRRYC